MVQRNKRFLGYKIDELIDKEDGVHQQNPKKKSKKEKKRIRKQKEKNSENLRKIEKKPASIPMSGDKLSEWKKDFVKRFKLNKAG